MSREPLAQIFFFSARLTLLAFRHPFSRFRAGRTTPRGFFLPVLSPEKKTRGLSG
jgi:hypothetical protein